MTTLAEIESAIEQLPNSDVQQLANWLSNYLAAQQISDDEWDAQIQDDADSGRLDYFIAEAKADIKSGNIKSLDEVVNNL